MADKFSKEVRSSIMSRIRGKNTSPEVIVFRYLRKEKVYFRKHYARALGSPDIAKPREKKAVFIDGDFWHGYNLERRKDSLPINWSMKIIRNVKRDKRHNKELSRAGWAVMRVWEHELKKSSRDVTLHKIKTFLEGGRCEV